MVWFVLALFLTAVGAQWFAGVFATRSYIASLALAGVAYTVRHWHSCIASLRPRAWIHPATGWAMGWLVPLLGLNWLLNQHALAPENVDLWSMILLFAVVPAVLEEWAFRGVLQPVIQSVWGPVVAVGGTATLFALAHRGSADQLVYLGAVGMLLGWVRWRTENLWSSVLIHLFHNLGAIAMFVLAR
jgi:membrane protease YdiL (CAAX protease family)